MGKLPATQPDPDSNILIILMGALGDLTRGLCLVSNIKNCLPKSKITWLVEPGCAPLVRLNPGIDRMIVFNRPKNILALLDLYKELSKETFDITLDLQRHFKSGFFSLLSGAKRRIGFNKRNAKEFNWLFNNEHIDYFSDDLPKLDHYLEFIKYMGLSVLHPPEFGFSLVDLNRSSSKIAAQIDCPFIAVVMGSSWDSKDWMFEKYCQLVDKILSTGNMQVVLLGDKSKIDPAQRLVENLGSSDKKQSLINLVGKTSTLELVAVLKEASAGIGPDSGPGHLSGAVGTPYISLFGPTSPKRVAPYGCQHLVIQTDVSCAPCNKRRCPGLDKICMSSISVGAVETKLAEALDSRNI